MLAAVLVSVYIWRMKNRNCGLCVHFLKLNVLIYDICVSYNFYSFLRVGCNVFRFSGALKWKEDLTQKAAQAFLRQQRSTPNLRKLVYGTGTNLFWNLHCPNICSLLAVTKFASLNLWALSFGGRVNRVFKLLMLTFTNNCSKDCFYFSNQKVKLIWSSFFSVFHCYSCFLVQLFLPKHPKFDNLYNYLVDVTHLCCGSWCVS